ASLESKLAVARLHGASPAQRLPAWIGAHVAFVSVAASGRRTRPRLGPKGPERQARRRHGQTGVKQEAACSAGLVDAPEPLAVAVELQNGRVVQHQHLLVRKAPRPRPLGMRGVHRLERHLVVVQEAVQAFQLSLAPYRLGEAEPRVSRQLQSDALQPLVAATVTERRTLELRPDVLKPHPGALITDGRKT